MMMLLMMMMMMAVTGMVPYFSAEQRLAALNGSWNHAYCFEAPIPKELCLGGAGAQTLENS